MTLFQRFGDHMRNELVLLAPADCLIPASLTRRYFGLDRHAHWLNEVQRVRGKIYLEDGALQASQVSAEGRHVQAADYDSWHLLVVNGNGDVQGCARYRHLTGNVGFDDLGVRESWLARCDRWGSSLKAAVQSEIARAKQSGAAFSEVGGWAIVPGKALQHRSARHRHGHLQPGTASGRLRRNQHSHPAAPVLRHIAADRRPIAGVWRHRTACLLRSAIPVPDGSSAIRFERAGSIVPAVGGSTE